MIEEVLEKWLVDRYEIYYKDHDEPLFTTWCLRIDLDTFAVRIYNTDVYVWRGGSMWPETSHSWCRLCLINVGDPGLFKTLEDLLRASGNFYNSDPRLAVKKIH